jgi:hypothetical protein
MDRLEEKIAEDKKRLELIDSAPEYQGKVPLSKFPSLIGF